MPAAVTGAPHTLLLAAAGLPLLLRPCQQLAAARAYRIGSWQSNHGFRYPQNLL
jgi:hypothetical protein